MISRPVAVQETLWGTGEAGDAVLANPHAPEEAKVLVVLNRGKATVSPVDQGRRLVPGADALEIRLPDGYTIEDVQVALTLGGRVPVTVILPDGYKHTIVVEKDLQSLRYLIPECVEMAPGWVLVSHPTPKASILDGWEVMPNQLVYRRRKIDGVQSEDWWVFGPVELMATESEGNHYEREWTHDEFVEATKRNGETKREKINSMSHPFRLNKNRRDGTALFTYGHIETKADRDAAEAARTERVQEYPVGYRKSNGVWGIQGPANLLTQGERVNVLARSGKVTTHVVGVVKPAGIKDGVTHAWATSQLVCWECDLDPAYGWCLACHDRE